MPAIDVVPLRLVGRAGGPSPLVRFALVGGVGFVVDASLCKALMAAGLPPLLSRVPSMLVGMMATFLLNRRFTFQAEGPLWAQAIRYGAVNAAGAAFNYTVFAVALLATQGLLPMAALVVGCGAGFSVNFLGAKHVAFRVPANDDRRVARPIA